MIELRTKPGERLLELGGGDNPNPHCHVNVDVRPGPKTHFTADFNEPLPIADRDFDGVFSQYVLEHLSWRKVKQFLGEVFRILKPGGKAVLVTANTAAQFDWIEKHAGGWDGKDAFESFSCVLFGDQDYAENSHRNYLSPAVAMELLQAAGFQDVVVRPYGERGTDMCLEAVRPPLDKSKTTEPRGFLIPSVPPLQDPVGHVVVDRDVKFLNDQSWVPPEVLYDKSYFNGGGKVGGYAREGFWDFPCHEVTTRHVLARKPESVLELGAARGYVLKRLQDMGIHCTGLEVSKHCHLTRVADDILLHNLLETPWPATYYRNDSGPYYDLCFSIATLEHIPENKLPAVISEMARTCKRGLHGIDFGAKDDGFDKTHCTLKPREWWVDKFNQYAPGWPVEIVDKEELERGEIPEEVYKGDGKVKLNIGCFTTMFHRGWLNIDVLDVNQFAQIHRYNFMQRDARQGLPFPTGRVDLIYSAHFLEHLSYEEGLNFLRECRRVIKPEGAMRIIVPDAALLLSRYHNHLCDITGNHSDFGNMTLDEFDEINDGAAACPTQAGKLWSLLHAGHSAAYDWDTLADQLRLAGFAATSSSFRNSVSKQILHETLDVLPCLSLYVDARPEVAG